MCKTEKMNDMRNWIKRHGLLLIAACELIIFTAILLSYFRAVNDLSVYELASDQILIQDVNGDVREGMLYITDEFLVEKGYYSYSVEYEGEAAGTWIYPYSYVDYYDKAEMKELYFEKGKSGEKLSFWVNADLMIRFYMWHYGEGAIHINSIRLEESPMQARKDLAGSLFFLGGGKRMFVCALLS